ncbi:MAG: cupredoxin domain-containing protein [Bacillota bacterium]
MAWMRLLLVLVVAVLMAGGCSTAVDQTAPGYEPRQEASPAPNTGGAAAPGQEVSVAVLVVDYTFTPNEIVVPLGAKVKLSVTNAGQHSHDFNILGEYGIEGDLLKPGESQVVEFVADKPGQFQVVCSQKGHKEQGMVARLVVR